MINLKERLVALQVGEVKEFEPLSKHTTIKIGGPAELFVIPSTIDMAQAAIKLAKEANVKWRTIGRGSNLLVADNGIDGLVLKLGSGLDDIVINGELVSVGAGYSLVSLATNLSRQGLSGLEFACGIPGSVGGAVYMNAGAHGSDISKLLVKAHVLFEDGTLQWFSNEEMKFAYRTSILQQERKGIILEAVFRLTQSNKDKVMEDVNHYKQYRKSTQPWNMPCAGSIFRNPLPAYAGQLIEDAELKGHQIGGAKISELHGNFIVNVGNATALDVLALIQHAKDTVAEKFGIFLETEVEIIGNI